MNASINPFISHLPVSKPGQFVDRQRELNTIVSNIRNNQSTVIIGGPKTGKTSLLRYLSNPQVRKDTLPFASYILKEIDCKTLLGESVNPAMFWKEVAQTLRERADKDTLWRINYLEEHHFETPYVREGLPILLQAMGKKLVLLLDEFEVLVVHRNFKADFWGSLISLLNKSSSNLVLVATSRENVASMNALLREYAGAHLSFPLKELLLGLLREGDLADLLHYALKESRVVFDRTDWEYIRTYLLNISRGPGF